MSFRELCRIPGKSGCFEVLFHNGRLESLRPTDRVDAGGVNLWLTPGLFDIQVNGMLGYDLSEEDLDIDKLSAIDEGLAGHGVLRWCPTICSNTAEVVERNLGIVDQALRQGAAPGIHCVHLEGHYVSVEEGYRGVHLPRFQRDPDLREFDRWQQAAGGHIGLFSLAPEREGALQFIAGLRARGVKAGLVHHHADHQTIRAAAAAGADLSSHLINGCATLIHRQHNIIWSQLSLDELWASFIADGYHIPDYTLRAAIRSKGIQRSILISDLSHLSGMPDGEYEDNEMTVVLKDGGLWVKEKGTNLLSGAARTLDQDVEFLKAQAGFPLEHALIMATVNPARYFGVEPEMQLYEGRLGTLAVFSWENSRFQVYEILK
jgi:N-acetylglucosamine-6-phosphate deacetylase